MLLLCSLCSLLFQLFSNVILHSIWDVVPYYLFNIRWSLQNREKLEPKEFSFQVVLIQNNVP